MNLIVPILFGTFLNILLTSLSPAQALTPQETFAVWPAKPPGVTPEGPERRLEDRPRPFDQLTGISIPKVEVYAPSPDKRTGAAWLVCPGGGLQRLAYEHEGLEIAQWAVDRGITAFVLKYRVPAPVASGVADVQRALSLIRSRASTWEIDPDSIGVIGFSAGGEIAAWMATHANERLYESIDAVDEVSCQMNYAVMIYPGGLLERGGGLKEALAERINSDHPPTFLVHASKDHSENSLHYALALKRRKVPLELHIYQGGGHGFGVRASGFPLGTWHRRLEQWLVSLGHLDNARVRAYAGAVIEGLPGQSPLPSFPADGSLEEALAVQRRVVRAQGDEVVGFKAAATSAAAQSDLGLSGPLAGALFSKGEVAMSSNHFQAEIRPGMLVETEIGYRIALDIFYEVLTAEQAREAVEAVLPVIEMPVNYASRLGLESMSAKQLVALNIGSDRFAFGESHTPGEVDGLDQVKARLTRDGEVLHEAGVDTLKGGQWETLRDLMNQITSQGLTIPQGAVILSGALGQPHPAAAGIYKADYGPLGEVTFEVTP